MTPVEKRKQDHVNHALDGYTEGESSWDAVRLDYYALPETNYSEIDCSTEFLGKKLELPLMVTAITGGWQGGKKINEELARACQEKGVAMGLGSQRAMIENPGLTETFQVRAVAPDVFLAANLGAYQLKEYGTGKAAELVNAIEADALCIHLNALQEAIQPEGDKEWRGCLAAIREACDQLKKPVIAKEVGAGINAFVAAELAEAGVKAIDVAGTGGTSFAAIEALRGGSKAFNDYGLTALESLNECRGATDLPLIASGGIRNGLHVAKALGSGASLAGAARPFLKAQQEGGSKAVLKLFDKWEGELRTAMLLTRSKKISEINGKRI
jgi:isopentenyl-diphosphate Delta-isomerase